MESGFGLPQSKSNSLMKSKSKSREKRRVHNFQIELYAFQTKDNQLDAIKIQCGSFRYPIKIQQIQFNLWMVMPFFSQMNCHHLNFVCSQLSHFPKVFNTTCSMLVLEEQKIKSLKWLLCSVVLWILFGILLAKNVALKLHIIWGEMIIFQRI